jgi:serine/threonine-protein kinase
MGHTLGQDRYLVTSKLGRGSYGAVYLARDMRLGQRQVAIKELLDPSPETTELFQREALLLAKLNHPGLVRVLDFFSEGRSQYLVMDYIEGRDLRDALHEAEQAHQHLDIPRVLEWIGQVCEAVAYLHSRVPPIMHRDIKPANIRLSTEGRAVLVDFGIAKVDPKAATIVMAKAVSAGFSPPEQYEGGGGTDTRSDVYALGATLYCLLTLKIPPDGWLERFVRKTPLLPLARFNPAVSSVLEEIVLKAMALEAVDRYQDAGRMLQALKAAAGPLELSSKPQPASDLPAASGLKCWRCGNLCRANARFCPKCGAAIGQVFTTPTCPVCGAPMRAEARFCKHCGTRRDAEASTPRLSDTNPHLARGRQCAQNGQWVQAVNEYEQALKDGLNTTALYFDLAQSYAQLARAADVVRVLEEALTQHPQEVSVQTQLAQAYFDAGKTVPGIQMLERAYRLTPDDEALGAQLAKTCFYADQLTQAERVLLALRQKQPRQAEWSFWLGMVDLKRGQADQALGYFRQTILLAPDYALAYYFIGDIYLTGKKWLEAASAYQRCAEINPSDVDPYIKLGQCYLALKQMIEAAAALRRALDIDPDNDLVRALLGQLPA